MEQKDWILKQIEQIGMVLARLLSQLLGLKNQGKVFNAIEITNQTLKGELDIDLEEFIELPASNVLSYLQNKNFNNKTLNQFADILLFIADELNLKEPGGEKCKKLYEKSLTIYEHINKTDSTYSFDRHYKIEKIKNVLYHGQ